MSKFTLLALNAKTNVLTKKAIADSGKSNIKAQIGLQYQVIDDETGKQPKKLVLKKKGKALHVEVDGEVVAVLKDFYIDAEGKQSPSYRVDDL